MAVVVLGIFSNTIIGIEGAILLALAHVSYHLHYLLYWWYNIIEQVQELLNILLD